MRCVLCVAEFLNVKKKLFLLSRYYQFCEITILSLSSFILVNQFKATIFFKPELIYAPRESLFMILDANLVWHKFCKCECIITFEATGFLIFYLLIYVLLTLHKTWTLFIVKNYLFHHPRDIKQPTIRTLEKKCNDSFVVCCNHFCIEII